MADLAARREARRLKILQNAESRLKRIRNLESGHVEESSTENNLNVKHNHDIPQNNSSEQVLYSTNYKDGSDDGITTLFQNERISTESSSHLVVDHVEKFAYRIWLVVVLAMFIRYLNLVTEKYASYIEVDVTGFHVNKIFVPLILYEIFEFVFIKPHLVSSNFLYSVLLLANIQPRFLNRLIEVFNVCVKFFQDLMIYFFTFIVCDYLIDVVFENR